MADMVRHQHSTYTAKMINTMAEIYDLLVNRVEYDNALWRD